MQPLLFPLDFTFKLSLANRFSVTDANGHGLYFVKQIHSDLFSETTLLNHDPYVDEVTVFKDESEAEALYTFKAHPSQNYAAAFSLIDKNGQVLGHVGHSNWVPAASVHYSVFDQFSQKILAIRESKPWIRISDTLLGKIPFLSVFTGYFFNPSYHVTRPDGTPIATLLKRSSFLSRRFTVTQQDTFKTGEQERLLLSLMVFLLQERRRG